jgi:multiple sugar transport system permease protein
MDASKRMRSKRRGGNMTAHARQAVRTGAFQTAVTLAAALLALMSFIPILLMLFLSLKTNAQIYADYWALPIPPAWTNYQTAWTALVRNMANSIITVTVGTLAVVTLSVASGYVFARLEFPGKGVLFMMMLALLMVPGVLTLTPSFKLMQALRIKNTWFALWFPWISGGQVMGMYMCRTFIAAQPASIFESARIDGAGEFQTFRRIAVPLSIPILATLVVMNMIGFYGDFIWPLLVIGSNRMQVISVAVRTFQSSQGSTRPGVMVAGFVMATVPLLVMFLFSSRLYIEGITSGAVKS